MKINIKEIEKYLKRGLKNKVSISNKIIITFLLTGAFISNAASLTIGSGEVRDGISNGAVAISANDGTSDLSGSNYTINTAIVKKNSANDPNYGGIAIGKALAVNGNSGSLYENASLAIGMNARAERGSVVLGSNASAGYQDPDWEYLSASPYASQNLMSSIAIGNSAFAGNNRSIAIGYRAKANGNTGLALGNESIAGGIYSSSVGRGTNALGREAISIGYLTVVSGQRALALGANSVIDSSSDEAVLLGSYTDNNLRARTVQAPKSVTVGSATVSAGEGSVSIGYNSQAGSYTYTNKYIVDFTGRNNSSKPKEGTASSSKAIAIGYQSKALGNNTISVGEGNVVSGEKTIAIGTKNIINGTGSGVFGDPNLVYGDNNYVIGNDNKVGASGAAKNNVFILGSNVDSTNIDNAVYLGNAAAAKVDKDDTTAGTSAYSSGVYNGNTDLLPILSFGGVGSQTADILTIGNATKSRRIQNVATGLISKTSTDAINGAQLYSAILNSKSIVLGKGQATVEYTKSEDGFAEYKVNAISPVRYKNEAGEEIIRAADGKYYKESDLANYIYKDGKWILKDQLNNTTQDAANLQVQTLNKFSLEDLKTLDNLKSALDNNLTDNLLNLKSITDNTLLNTAVNVNDLKRLGWVLKVGENKANIVSSDTVEFEGTGLATVTGVTNNKVTIGVTAEKVKEAVGTEFVKLDASNLTPDNISAWKNKLGVGSSEELDSLKENTIKLTGDSGETNTQRLDKQDGLSFEIAKGDKSISTVAEGNSVKIKVADGGIDTSKLADNAVTEDKIEDGAVTTDKIADGAITADKLSEDLKSALDSANAARVFKGDNTDVKVSRNSGEILSIVGGATKLSENNIGTVGNEDGSIAIKLSKELTGLTNAEFKDENGNTTVTNAEGITITPNEGETVSLTKDGLNNGGNRISNIAAPEEDTDAVNKKYVDDLIDKSQTSSYTNQDGDSITQADDGKLYKTSDLENKIYENGNWYAKGEDGNKTGEPLTGDEIPTPLESDKVVNNLVNPNGEGPVTLGNVKSALGLNGTEGNDGENSSTSNPSAINSDAARKAIAGEDGESGLLTESGPSLNKATTLGDLQAIAQAGLTFGANEGEDIHRPLGTKINIVGKVLEDGESVNEEDYTFDNLATFTDAESNTIKIGMIKNPEFKSLKIKAEEGAVPVEFRADNQGNLIVNKLNSEGNPLEDNSKAKISNLEKGEISATSTDAVTGAQLYEIEQKSASALGGISTAVAMANLPQINSIGRNNRHNVAASYGTYMNEHAFALGLSGVNKEGTVIYKVSGAVNTRGNVSFGAGLGYQFDNDGLVENDIKLEDLHSELFNLKTTTTKTEDKVKVLEEEVSNLKDQVKELLEIIKELKNKK